MSFLNKEWFAVSENSQLRALDVSVIFASALFWTWLEFILFSPALFEPFGFEEAFPLFRLLVLAAGFLTLVLAASYPRRTTELLDSRRWELSFDGASVFAGLLAIAGAWQKLWVLPVIAGLTIGVSFPYFMLEWCRMYSRRGARTAAPLITGALTMSFAVDFVIAAIDPIVKAVLITVLPAIIVLTLFGIQALVRSASRRNESIVTLFDPLIAIGASNLMTVDPSEGKETEEEHQAPKSRPFPIALAAAAALCGISYGILIGNGAFETSSMGPLLIGCMLSTGITFGAACLKPSIYRILTNAIIVIGIAGLMFGLDGSAIPVANPTPLAGFVAMFSGIWALSGFRGARTKRRMIRLFAANMASLGGGLMVGLALGANVLGIALDGNAHLISACMLVVAALLLMGAWSSPIDIFKAPTTASGTSAIEDTKHHAESVANEIADAYSLTDREREILGHLIIGRSRPRIAEILYVSENTVNSHIRHIYRKLDIHSFQELLDFVYHPDSQQ